MKRILAITALLTALAVLGKLAFKRVEPRDASGRASDNRAPERRFIAGPTSRASF